MRRVFPLILMLCACSAKSDGPSFKSPTAGQAAQLILVSPDELTRRTQDFYSLLTRLDEHGLDPNRYGLSRVAAIRGSDKTSERIELDFLLTRALLQLVVDARYGRAEAREADGGPTQRPATQNPEAVQALQTSALEAASDPSRDIGKFIEALFPQHGQYAKMKQALSAYRELLSAGGWPSIPEGRALNPGDTDARVTLLAERLRVSGDLRAERVASECYDPALVRAVQCFQQRHGLKSDGVVGRQTIEAMNVSVEQRVRELTVNLERWRWLDRNLGQRFVMVNLAGFELVLVEKDEKKQQANVLLRTPVIVGKTFQSTPVFSSTIRYLEFNPYWNVPKSIETKEIRPNERTHPGYIASQHMQILDTDGWVRIRQSPGPWNALGAVKFVFPNPYDVYLHDTPSKSLFQQSNRTLSHGCIRVKDPLLLAEFLLGGERAGWGTSRLEEIVRTEKNLKVPLLEAVPIHIVYRTAWVDLDNSIHFRSDVYGRDMRMIGALFGAEPSPDRWER